MFVAKIQWFVECASSYTKTKNFSLELNGRVLLLPIKNYSMDLCMRGSLPNVVFELAGITAK